MIDAENDVDLWGKMPYWRIHEGVALLCGEDPLRPDEISDLPAKRRAGIWELAQRALDVKRLSDPIEPILFLEWATQNNLSPPQLLLDTVAQYHEASVDWKAEAELERVRAEKAEKAFDHYLKLAGKRESQIQELEAEIMRLQVQAGAPSDSAKAVALQRSIGSLVKLVGGMAIAAYGFNPHERRSSVVKQIQSDLDLKGIELDEDTIRKWLKEGGKIVKPQ